jgi:hypothetical protein
MLIWYGGAWGMAGVWSCRGYTGEQPSPDLLLKDNSIVAALGRKRGTGNLHHFERDKDE